MSFVGLGVCMYAAMCISLAFCRHVYSCIINLHVYMHICMYALQVCVRLSMEYGVMRLHLGNTFIVVIVHMYSSVSTSVHVSACAYRE